MTKSTLCGQRGGPERERVGGREGYISLKIYLLVWSLRLLVGLFVSSSMIQWLYLSVTPSIAHCMRPSCLPLALTPIGRSFYWLLVGGNIVQSVFYYHKLMPSKEWFIPSVGHSTLRPCLPPPPLHLPCPSVALSDVRLRSNPVTNMGFRHECPT